MKGIYKFLTRLVLGLTLLSYAVRFVAAVAPISIETDWDPAWYYDKSSLASSTHSITGTGVSWAVLAVGADATFTISVTTKTSGTVPDNVTVYRSTSVTMTALDGKGIAGEFKVLSVDPKIIIHGLNTASTVYVWMDYGTDKAR